MKEYHKMNDIDCDFTENDTFANFLFYHEFWGGHLRCLSIKLDWRGWTYIIHMYITIIVLFVVVNIFMKAFFTPRNSNKSEGLKQLVIEFNDNCKVIIKFNSLADHKRLQTSAGFFFIWYSSDFSTIYLGH